MICCLERWKLNLTICNFIINMKFYILSVSWCWCCWSPSSSCFKFLIDKKLWHGSIFELSVFMEAILRLLSWTFIALSIVDTGVGAKFDSFTDSRDNDCVEEDMIGTNHNYIQRDLPLRCISLVFVMLDHFLFYYFFLLEQ